MERMVKPDHEFEPNKTSSSPLAMHKDSHVISKFKPKIRIVHIFAPEIIKTDVENFRELVQRLTGKPTERKAGKKKAMMRSNVKRQELTRAKFCATKNNTVRLGDHQRIKDEEDDEEEEMGMWGVENNSSGFFGGLGDLDSFIQGLGEYPLLSANASHMDVFGEMHFLS